MTYKKVKLPDSEDYNGTYIFGNSALGFHNGETLIPGHQEEEFKRLHPKATFTDHDPEKDGKDLTSYYYYKMEGHDVAKEKENLSLDNVADAHALAPQRFAEHTKDVEGPAAFHRQTVNNWDSTVKIVPNLEGPKLIPDDEIYRSVPVSTASKAVEKKLDERGDLARKQAKSLRDGYEGSNTSRDESLERGTTVRAPLDNLRTANPAQKEALKQNEKTAELVEKGSEGVAREHSDAADEKYGGVDASKKAANEKKFAKTEENRQNAEGGS